MIIIIYSYQHTLSDGTWSGLGSSGARGVIIITGREVPVKPNMPSSAETTSTTDMRVAKTK